MTITDALGWTLLHTIWEGAAAALLLAVPLCFINSPRARYLAACAALTASLAAFIATFVHFVPLDSIVSARALVLQLAPVGSGSLLFDAQAANKTDLPRWIAIVWLMGTGIFQVRAWGGWFAVSRMRRAAVCTVPAAWNSRLKALAAELRVARPIALLESRLTEVPVVVGHLKPVIFLPVGLLTGLPADQIETILLHELAHVLRHDYLVNLLQTMAEAFLFYHPATWWISSVIRAERENCCDDLVVAVSGDAHRYALALTALAEGRSSLAMAASGGSVFKRVRRLLQKPEGSRTGLLPVLTASLIVIACALGLTRAHAAPQSYAPLAELAPTLAEAPEQPEPQTAPGAKPTETPFTQWLNADVAYIIREEERAAFQRLTTDAEREMFIEQFWLRRDPTPDTIANEFKDEHYRRIAYANQHYGVPSGLAGWKTDRGRVYISFGPADEIESHPSGGGGKAYPYEQWRYKFIEGVGTNVILDFVDTGNTGEFRMTTDPINVRG
jgi:GWxTD domain-containing protein